MGKRLLHGPGARASSLGSVSHAGRRTLAPCERGAFISGPPRALPASTTGRAAARLAPRLPAGSKRLASPNGRSNACCVEVQAHDRDD
jgi:hypothetical protein